MTETTSAEAIASQVIDLKSTELLVLTVPEDLRDQDFDRLRNELHHILDRANLKTESLAVVVLREGMTLEALDEPALRAKLTKKAKRKRASRSRKRNQ